MRRLDRGAEVVERTGVDVAGLQEDDRRAAARRERLAERVDADAALLVARDRDRRAQPEVSTGEVHGAVALLADDEADRRAARHAGRLDVPSGATHHGVTGRGHARELRHRRSRRESDLLPDGSPSTSTSHSSASSSTATAAGVMVQRAVFWSHVDTSQSAASATGWVPPMTQP